MVKKKTQKKERWTTVDYAVRCLLTGDEEETRLQEEIPGWIADFKKEGVSASDLVKLEKLMRSKNWDYGGQIEKAQDILEKYITHKKYWKDGTWEARYSRKLERE